MAPRPGQGGGGAAKELFSAQGCLHFCHATNRPSLSPQPSPRPRPGRFLCRNKQGGDLPTTQGTEKQEKLFPRYPLCWTEEVGMRPPVLACMQTASPAARGLEVLVPSGPTSPPVAASPPASHAAGAATTLLRRLAFICHFSPGHLAPSGVRRESPEEAREGASLPHQTRPAAALCSSSG